MNLLHHSICLLWLVLIPLGGYMLLRAAMIWTQKLTRRKVELRVVFKDFRQKMWMTGGIGTIFFGLYLCILLLSSLFRDTEQRLNVFLYMYKHPTECIYLGLFTFVTVSVSIYVVRLWIKYLYRR